MACPHCNGTGRVIVTIPGRVVAWPMTLIKLPDEETEWPCRCPAGVAWEAEARPLADVIAGRRAAPCRRR